MANCDPQCISSPIDCKQPLICPTNAIIYTQILYPFSCKQQQDIDVEDFSKFPCCPMKGKLITPCYLLFENNSCGPPMLPSIDRYYTLLSCTYIGNQKMVVHCIAVANGVPGALVHLITNVLQLWYKLCYIAQQNPLEFIISSYTFSVDSGKVVQHFLPKRK